jgi:hypothetical protein
MSAITPHLHLIEFSGSGDVTCCPGWKCCEGSSVKKSPRLQDVSPHEWTLRFNSDTKKFVPVDKTPFKDETEKNLKEEENKKAWAALKEFMLASCPQKKAEIDTVCRDLGEGSKRLAGDRFCLAMEWTDSMVKIAKFAQGVNLGERQSELLDALRQQSGEAPDSHQPNS